MPVFEHPGNVNKVVVTQITTAPRAFTIGVDFGLTPEAAFPFYLNSQSEINTLRLLAQGYAHIAKELDPKELSETTRLYSVVCGAGMGFIDFRYGPTSRLMNTFWPENGGHARELSMRCTELADALTLTRLPALPLPKAV